MRLILAAVCVWALTRGGNGAAGQLPTGADRPDIPSAGKPDPEQVLQQVLLDVLTNPLLKSARDFYGTPGDKRVTLQSDSEAPWPRGWRPKVPGYEVRFRPGSNPVLEFLYRYAPGGDWLYYYTKYREPRMLGVALGACNLDPTRDYTEQVRVTLFNIGGDAGGDGADGGCTVYYTLRREKGQWVAEYAGSIDP